MDCKLNFNTLIALFMSICMVPALSGPSEAGEQSTATLKIPVGHIEDDAEENSSGNVNRNIFDLELGDKICGIRFDHVKIPKGSTITNAYIQFTVDEVRDVMTMLTIWGESDKDSHKFEEHINDISNRLKTANSVVWDNVPPWGQIGETDVAQQTLDLSVIVQEIIDLPDWDYDKAVTFIFEGSGERVAEAYRSGEDVACTAY